MNNPAAVLRQAAEDRRARMEGFRRRVDASASRVGGGGGGGRREESDSSSSSNDDDDDDDDESERSRTHARRTRNNEEDVLDPLEWGGGDDEEEEEEDVRPADPQYEEQLLPSSSSAAHPPPPPPDSSKLMAMFGKEGVSKDMATYLASLVPSDSVLDPTQVDVQDSLTCVACMNVVQRALSWGPECPHVVCADCLVKSFGTTHPLRQCMTKCPGTSLRSLTRNSAIDGIVASAKMACPDGCPSKFTVGVDARGIRNHANQCPCAKLPCPHCKEPIERRHLATHTTECNAREFTCDHCGETIKEKDRVVHNMQLGELRCGGMTECEHEACRPALCMDYPTARRIEEKKIRDRGAQLPPERSKFWTERTQFPRSKLDEHKKVCAYDSIRCTVCEMQVMRGCLNTHVSQAPGHMERLMLDIAELKREKVVPPAVVAPPKPFVPVRINSHFVHFAAESLGKRDFEIEEAEFKEQGLVVEIKNFRPREEGAYRMRATVTRKANVVLGPGHFRLVLAFLRRADMMELDEDTIHGFSTAAEPLVRLQYDFYLSANHVSPEKFVFDSIRYDCLEPYATDLRFTTVAIGADQKHMFGLLVDMYRCSPAA